MGIGHAVNLGQVATIKFLGVCSYGKASIGLGDIYQNEDFIEVNNIRFYSPSVEINFVRSHIIARPEIELAIPFKSSSKTSVFFRGGYQFPLKIYTNRLEFRGENFYGENIREEESIFSNNLTISHNEQPITSNVIEMKGVVIEGGLSVSF
ncbi:MAG: hypothetical protein HWE22_06210 [Flavobacteriales bacterium]|nr:hypothetical protein [Flavobacteriales bacterium]